ncbi:nitrogen regulation protein NR(II) [Paraburkholderia sp. BL25I1N1]|uniref:two-component system sensor histidine kinase NtrB n=1 Tax=Paraburkholderia sp. BL25I1N1 TaxID=1938804 RepID=UPI000D074D2F|nr:PAS domain-containing sensor histidine kinase [Paraburkholderia sp. BL25I1N1]PRY08521.1 two-component system sensor kinase FixL [Paraburkholderia sp. BL25I1N1]
MINLIVRGKDLVQGMVGIAMACCYMARLRPPRDVHRQSRASPISARSPRERAYWRLRTPGAKSLAFFGDVADQPEKWIAANERELANAKPGRHAHAGASAAGLQAERCGRRGILDERIHLRDALEMLPLAMLTLDRKNQIVFANARAIELFGYTSEELTGAPIEMLFPVHAWQGCDSMAEDRGTRHRSADRATTQVLVARRRDGEGFHVEADTSRYSASDQGLQIIAIAGLVACREVDQNRKEMAHLVRVSSLGELASSLAHELNQPLTAILSNAQAAQKLIESEKVNTAELRETLGDIILDNRRASEVIQKIRTMVRKGDLELQPVDIGDVVRDIALLVHSDAVAREVRTEFDIADNLQTLFGDRVQLQQVLLNLLLNAFDAVKDCDPAERVIETTVREGVGGGVRITVKDRGQGLTVDKMNKIFRPFFSTKPQGLGLGLSISRTIVTAHGGWLWAENNECKGASFHIMLPQKAAVRRDPRGAS